MRFLAGSTSSHRSQHDDSSPFIRGDILPPTVNGHGRDARTGTRTTTSPGRAVTGAFEYAIYGRTSGSWTLLGISWPGVTWWDDYGSTMSGNWTFYGWLPDHARRASAQNGVLTTTVTAGGGTTSLTLAAAATNSVTRRICDLRRRAAICGGNQQAHHQRRPAVHSVQFIVGRDALHHRIVSAVLRRLADQRRAMRLAVAG